MLKDIIQEDSSKDKSKIYCKDKLKIIYNTFELNSENYALEHDV